MKLFPYERFYLKTDIEPKIALERLQREVGSGPQFSYGRKRNDIYPEYFTGYLIGNTFRFTRALASRNLYMPKIDGSVTGDDQHSKIHVRMRMELSLLIFCVLTVMVAGIVTVEMANDALIASKMDNDIYISVAVMLFFWLMPLTRFKIESKKAKNKLKEIFEGEVA